VGVLDGHANHIAFLYTAGGRADLSSGASIATEESLHQREASSPAGGQGLASHRSTRLPGGGGR
jgi:hypothetical protein